MHSLTKPFRIWRRVTIGSGLSELQLVENIFNAGCKIREPAAEFIERSYFSVSSVREEVDFVLVAVMQLGLIRASLETLVERARELGLRPCTVEEALALRIQYSKEQMNDGQVELISLAMDPIETKFKQKYHRPSVLCLAGGKASFSEKPELTVRHLYSGVRGKGASYDGLDHEVWAFVSPRKN